MKRIPAIDQLFRALAGVGDQGGSCPWPAVLVAWAALPVTDSAIARALNDEQVWPRGLREQAVRWLSDPQGSQHLYAHGIYSVLPAKLLSTAEDIAAKERDTTLRERHLVQGMATDSRGLQVVGVDRALLVDRVLGFEAGEDSNRFTNLRNHLRQLQADLSPDKERDANYLADLDSFRRTALGLLNQELGEGNSLGQAFGMARQLGAIGTFENLVSGELIRYDRILAEAEQRSIERSAESRTREGEPTELLAELRRLISQGNTREVASFLNEALRCLEVRAFRATAIMVWAGAISILHDAAERHGLTAFSEAARLVNSKARSLSKRDDLQYYDDELLLKTLEKASMVNRTELGLLLQQLKRRNAYAHPSGIDPSVEEVRALVSELVRIVFSRFSLTHESAIAER